MDEILIRQGYVPQGLSNRSELWKCPLPDYPFQGWKGKDLFSIRLAYILSALAGIATITGVVLLIGRVLVKEHE